MIELFHPAFGAFVALTRNGRTLWTDLDGGRPERFESKSQALSTLASLPIGQERQMCRPIAAR